MIDYHKNDIAKRKQLLRKLNQGAAYRYMVNNVFPKLRRSEITIVREIPEVTECYNISGDYETEILKAVETGSNPSFRWMYEDNPVFDNTPLAYKFYSVTYTDTFDRAVEIYKELNEAMKDVVNQPITNHEKVAATDAETGKTVSGVYATTYGNNVKTFFVNYNSFDVTLEDGTVVPAKNYTWR